MMVFKRVGITLAVVLFLSIILSGLQIYFDMTKREEDMSAFVRLAVKDAIVNIQTTEEQSLNVVSSWARRRSTERYGEYLEALANQTSNSEVLSLLHSFLKNNADSKGDARFRPIQFGMTYVDTELFKESFTSSLQKLIDSNYSMDSAVKAANGNKVFDLKATDTLAIKTDICYGEQYTPNGGLADRTSNTYKANVDGYDIYLNIKGPNLVTFSTNDPESAAIYKSLYGADKRNDYVVEENLGFTIDTMPDFYVYYDINIVVGWSFMSTNPLLRKSFLGDTWQVPNNYFSRANDYLAIPGRPIEYTYRYVLLN